MKRINVPFTVFLKNISIISSNININNLNFNLKMIFSNFILKNKDFNINNTKISSLEINLPKSQKKKNNYKYNLIYQQNYINKLNLFFLKKINSHKIIIPMDINIKDFIISNFKLKGNYNLNINNLDLIVFNKKENIFIKKFIINTQKINISLFGAIDLNKTLQMHFSGVYKNKFLNSNNQKTYFFLKCNVFNKFNLLLKTYGIINLKTNLQIDFLQKKPMILFILDSNKFVVPYKNNIKYKFKNIHLYFCGHFFNYNFSLQTNINEQNIPISKILVYGKGNNKQINFNSLQLITSYGKANINGVINLNNCINWNAKIELSNINLKKQLINYPVKINGKITTKGSIYKNLLKFEFSDIFLNGKIKNNKLKILGQIKFNTLGYIYIKNFNLLLGKNYLNVNGIIDNKCNINIKVNIFEVNNFFSHSSGAIFGNIKLRGELQFITVFFNFNVYDISFKNYFFIKKIKINGNVILKKQIAGNIFIELDDFKKSNFFLKKIIFNAYGNEKQHILKTNIISNHISGNFILFGSFNRITEIWDGRLNDCVFNTVIGVWKLKESVILKYINKTKKMIVDDQHWENKNSSIYIPKFFKTKKTNNITIILNSLNLKLLEPLLNNNTRINGIFSGKIDIIWNYNNKFTKINLVLKGNKIKFFQYIKNKFIPIEFNLIILNIKINNDIFDINWLFKINDNGKFEGNIKISNINSNKLLSGKININNIDFNFIKIFLKEKNIISSNFNANLILSGTINNPMINGCLSILNIKAKSSIMPFDITNGSLNIIFNGMSLLINGHIYTTNGFLNTYGYANWKNINTWNANIKLKSNNSHINLLEIGKVDIQTDILFKVSPKLLIINGKVYIPWAKFIIEKTPEFSVNQSLDVVILDSKKTKNNRKIFFPNIQTNLDINIGSDVQLDAFGLKAYLTGLLKVVQNSHSLYVNGQVNVQSGRICIYGQDLFLRKGEILFSGPINKPFLNFNAIRDPDNTADNVIAGINLTGFVDKLKINVFSEPIKTQQEAISYLLKGEGINNSDYTTSFKMTSMLISLGISKTSRFIEKVGKIFGISDLTMDVYGSGNNSQVIVSGKITNNLQIKYGVGVFDSLAKLTLRYKLMPKLYLEAVSGVNKALDIVYQFNF